MRLKKGVNIVGVQPPIWYAIGVAQEVYQPHATLVATSLNDGEHNGTFKCPEHGFFRTLYAPPTAAIEHACGALCPLIKPSLHFTGNAVDLRKRDIPDSQVQFIFDMLRSRLDWLGFDLVLEGDHYHVEYDPKQGENWIKEVS